MNKESRMSKEQQRAAARRPEAVVLCLATTTVSRQLLKFWQLDTAYFVSTFALSPRHGSADFGCFVATEKKFFAPQRT